MTADSQSWQQLVDFLDAKLGQPPFGRNRFTRDTDLYHDLDLNPPEISKLLTEWSMRFGVDMGAFNIARYYPSSQLNKAAFFGTLFKSPFSRLARQTLGGWQLTLGMLEEAMIRRKWLID